MTRVKICGMTRPEDARAASAAGADAVGLVFWPGSPRCVTLEQAAAIVGVLDPFVTVVGVFVDQPVPDVSLLVRRLGLAAIQLHGDEDAAAYAGLGCRVLKAVGVDAAFEPERLAGWPAAVVPLLDAADRERRGGTGRRVDWALASRAAALRPIVLSGGLTPETVGEAIRVVRPAAVDVSSGVEETPGIKSAARMARFIDAVRRLQ